MSSAVRYAHIDLVARDWQPLVRFYTAVFDRSPVGPERDSAGDWLAAATGVGDAHLHGQHLLLPGTASFLARPPSWHGLLPRHGGSGPTLEIYTYQETAERRRATAHLYP